MKVIDTKADEWVKVKNFELALRTSEAGMIDVEV